MAFSSTNPPQLIVDTGIGTEVPTNPSANVSPSIYVYRSTHNSTDITATGFFAGCGYGSRHVSTPSSAPPIRASIGMRVGDIVLAIASSAASVAGRVTWHSVVNSTANNASTTASTGWLTAYNVTVSSS
jgi:hypothetical protein